MSISDRRHIRRKARRTLLQVLYEVDASEHALDDSLRWVLEQARLDEHGRTFVCQLARKVVAHRIELDKQIQRYASDWPVEQLSVIDRNILRIAIYEVELEQETPPKVAINEAVELAKYFGSEGSQRFVNGVLGTLMTEI